ncbi:hypothetical protein [Modestobacter italicus]|uniref:hypothetical protein n=1 Tax=Modestobacter italicus (strain DSM 44449 / CECT 9708 / BC 501) TaxID=2732864 RepID=UPI001C965384|nr:hypothetical protein [Modestobacter italicus]
MRPWSSGLAAVLVTAGLCGCGPGVIGEDCLPELPTVQPAEVAAGGQVTIASTGFACDDRYEGREQYSLELLSLGRADPVDLGDVEVDPDGSFWTVVTVPVDASPGESHVAVHGSPYDEPCDDTGSCASYGVDLTVTPAP